MYKPAQYVYTCKQCGREEWENEAVDWYLLENEGQSTLGGHLGNGGYMFCSLVCLAKWVNGLRSVREQIKLEEE